MSTSTMSRDDALLAQESNPKVMAPEETSGAIISGPSDGGSGEGAPPAHSKSVSNKRRMWPPGQQQRQQPDRDSQAFMDLCLPKVNHDDPPPQLNAVPRQKHEHRFLACFVRHIRSDEQKLLCSCAQPMLGMRCLRQLLRQQESPLRGLP
jgi:hypothetical protein